MTPVLATFYRWPGDLPAYQELLSRLGPGDALVLNPASGDVYTAEGRGERDQWVDVREAARDRGVWALLYQPVGWGAVDAGTTEARINRALQWCDWDGVFYDEAPSTFRWWWAIPGSWLLRLHGKARAMIPGRRGLSVWNPGTGIDRRLQRLPGSIWVTYEGPGGDGRIPYPQRDIDPTRAAALVYGAPLWQPMRDNGSSGYGWYYATTDHGPFNPWDGAPDT